MRTTRRTVTFDHPFTLPGIDGEQPPGSYIVATDEEEIPGLSFTSWRRIETSLRLPAVGRNSGLEQVNTINPRDLEAALTRDSRRYGPPIS